MKALAGVLGAALMLLAAVAHGKATVVIVNADSPDAGFNDPTPVSPVGGNCGTTLGAQRLVVFQKAAEISGNALESAAPITGPFALPAIELYQHRAQRSGALDPPTSSQATIPRFRAAFPGQSFRNRIPGTSRP